MSVTDVTLSAEAALRRALWRSRRGMKELDLLLERFARGPLLTASPAEQARFEELLRLPDPQLAGYLLSLEGGFGAILGGQNPRDR
jgi:succinate dehydrogenase flavin-adding protein (antitoxin of CptAB toxin-antitoxin module)